MAVLLAMMFMDALSKLHQLARKSGVVTRIAGLFLASLLVCAAGAAEEVAPAELKVSGYGIFGNRELKNLLRLLQPSDQEPPHFIEANFIEDAALILFSRVRRDGYLNARITADVMLDDGTRRTFEMDERLENALPRPLKARAVQFRIRHGVLFHFRKIEFEGLESIPGDEALHLFVETDALLPLKKTRVFTPQRLARGLSNLKELLERAGYENALATATELQRDTRTGDIDVKINVVEGRKTLVRTARKEVWNAGATNAVDVVEQKPMQPFSRLWIQDQTQTLKREQYRLGFPDTTVDVSQIRRDQTNGIVLVDVLMRVNTGQRFHIRDVRFEGRQRTREELLDQRVRLDDGDLLDRIKVEEGRHRLSRLGVFRSVDLEYEDVDEQTRDVVFRLQEGRRIDVSLLAGIGSYELLRGGFDIEQFNVFGRAHRARLRAIQSFKSSSVSYLYTMPELVGHDIDVFLNSSWLTREEVSFTREEFGGGIGARRYFKPIASELSLRYDYQVLSASRRDFDPTVGVGTAGVGAMMFELRHDARDNPLVPRSGYKVFSSFEVASEYLASEVNYQRIEIATSWHNAIGRGRWLHLGLSHGVALTSGKPVEDLPFNKRFFPGGDDSIRGFQRGEAAPRNERGGIIGAETFTLGNVELEQALTSTWSLVGFFDAIGFAKSVSDYPFDETLFSVGGGIRWKTLIGPVRVEYGYNLNPRDRDPSGTLHFSLGFPF